jgi:hypothetical protein
MSAYVVNPEHVGALAAYTLNQCHPNIALSLQGKNKNESARNIARCLMQQNIRSVAVRYPCILDGNRPGVEGLNDAELLNGAVSCAATYLILPPKLSALDIINMANCYDYQACETDDYESTVAHKQLQKIIDSAIHNLAGYDNAIRHFCDQRFSWVVS